MHQVSVLMSLSVLHYQYVGKDYTVTLLIKQRGPNKGTIHSLTPLSLQLLGAEVLISSHPLISSNAHTVHKALGKVALPVQQHCVGQKLGQTAS